MSGLFPADLNGLLGSGVIPILLVFGVFYLMLIRPAQQQQKQQKTMLAAIKRGDRVVAAGGILGTVQRVQDTELEIEVAQGIRIAVLRDSVAKVLAPTGARPVPAGPRPVKA